MTFIAIFLIILGLGLVVFAHTSDYPETTKVLVSWAGPIAFLGVLTALFLN